LISYYRYLVRRNGRTLVAITLSVADKVVRMSKSPTVRHQQVAEDILAKAGTLFDELGYGRTSLQDIADAVGIARPSLYHYFRSKEEILAVLVERTTLSREVIADEVARMEAPPLERLSALLRRIGHAIAANPIGLRLTLNNAGSLPNDIQQRSIRSRRTVFELLSEILRDGMDAGILRPMPPRDSAAIIIAALTGLQYREIGGERIDPDSAADTLERMLIEGLSQPTDRRATNATDAMSLLRADLDVLEHHLHRE